MEAIKKQPFQSGRINTHVLSTSTYKTNTIVLQMAAPLNESKAAERSVLANVLKTATEYHPTRRALQKALEELYGMVLSADVYKKGENHIVSLRAEVANEKYLRDQTPLTETALKVMAEVLLAPKLTGNAFDERIVSDEKRALKQKLASIYDDKMRYANKRLIEEMCRNEPFASHVYGNEEAIDAIGPTSLYSFYESMLENDQVDLYIMGDVDKEDCLSWVNTYFTDSRLLRYNRSEEPGNIVSGQTGETKEITEEQDVQQGKLHIGYRTGIVYGEDDYFPLQVFNGLFGGFPHSKLFMNVREKASLAYYAASRLETHKGLMIVMAGIASDDEKEAKSIIFAQMDAMKSGDFTEEDIAQTKAVLKNQVLEMADSPRGRIELEYYNALSKVELSLEEWLAQIDQVTAEDIRRVGEKVRLDTIYFLRGMEGEQHEND